MAINDLFAYMRVATHQMQSEYDRIRKRAAEDPGTAGDNGEENWAELLRTWLPASYHIVTKGRIMNAQGECGPQVDILVLSPAYPKILLGRKEYLEGGVLAAFECKLTLKADHVRTAVQNAAIIRRLSRPMRKGSPYRELHTRLRYGLLAHSHIWQGSQSTPVDNIEKHLYEAETEETRHPKEVLDTVCVSDLATWRISKLVVAGERLLSQMRLRYERMGDFWTTIQQAGGAIEANHVCFTEEYQTTTEKKQLFTPIGSFLTTIFEMLAWEDVSLRPLAEYLLVADLLGSGQGSARMWALNVLSDELAGKLRQGECLVSGERWHEWSMCF
jgi:hypothetical protein